DQRRRLDPGHLLQRFVCDTRLGLVAEGLGALSVGALTELPLEIREGRRLLLEEAWGEDPEPDLSEELEHPCGARVRLPAPDQRLRVWVGPPPAAVEDEGADEP